MVTAVEYRVVTMTASTMTQNALVGYVRRNASGAVVSSTPAMARDGVADRCTAESGTARCVPGMCGRTTCATGGGGGRGGGGEALWGGPGGGRARAGPPARLHLGR